MVFFTENPSRVLAACCSVEVMNGAEGAGRLVLPLTDPIGQLLELGGGGERGLLIHRPEGLAPVFAHLEADAVGTGRQQIGMDFPEFFRHEGPDLAFALDNQAHRDRLHPPRGEAAGDLGPQ